MKNIIYIILLTVGISFAQTSEKYLIYFKDKGVEKSAVLMKNSEQYKNAVNSLSERSLKRRMKTMGEDFITYEDLPVNQEYINNIEALGAKIIWKLKWFNAVSAFLTEEQLQKIKQLNFIDKIEKVKKLNYKKDVENAVGLGKIDNTNETGYKYDYGASLTQYELSDIPLVHNLGYSGEGVLIGILDAGFAWEGHTALKTRHVIAERDFVNGDTNTDDGDASHGTAVFSLIGGFDEGNIVGPSFNAQFIVAKTEYIYTETHVEEDNYAAALEWMDSLGVDITTSSLGYSEFDSGEGDYTYADMNGKTTIVTKAAELAFDRGILTITSAGNEGNSSWKYITAPADGINTIAVGAVDYRGYIASFSSVGPTADGRIKPELVAQGVSCYHAVAYSNTYGSGSGTSYSAPIAAGIAGQLLSAFPYLTNKQMRTILIEGCDSTESPNNTYGYGLLSSLEAIQFPNIEKGESVYNLHKIFNDPIGIINDNVFLYYRVNSNPEFNKLQMSVVDNPNHYLVSLLGYSLAEGDTISFYFEYSDSANIVKRVPVDKNYKVIYSSTDVALSTELNPPTELPESFELKQNYPNPFNPSTIIEYSVPVSDKVEASNVKLIVYDILGREVATLVNESLKAGTYSKRFDATNLSSGIYIYRLQSGSFNVSKKMVFLR